MGPITSTNVREAVARGYCHFPNAQKELDTDLLNAIVDEVMTLMWGANWKENEHETVR